jgi:hypothetical protein
MHRKFLISMCLAGFLATASAAEVVLNPAHPQNYTVVRGDTLWDIAGRFLTHPWQWPDIWQVNPQIRNPHLIYPGDLISLTYQDGKPILSLTRGGAFGGRNVKLTPSVRESAHDDAIPPIPLDAIHQFLSRPKVVTEADIDSAAYIVGSQDDHLAVGVGGRVYIRGLPENPGNKFSVFRPGGAYKDPDTGAVLGYEALHVADLTLHALGDPATGVLTWSNREVLKGDRLMPQELDEYPDFIPRAPGSDIQGRIISVIDGVSQIGQHHVVVINKGAADGLEPGHVLAIFQAGQEITDPIGTEMAHRQRLEDLKRQELENPSKVGRFFDGVANDVRDAKLKVDKALGERIGGAPVKVQLPEERAGELLVFRTFDSVSYGLVMNTQRPVHVLDKIRNP